MQSVLFTFFFPPHPSNCSCPPVSTSTLRHSSPFIVTVCTLPSRGAPPALLTSFPLILTLRSSSPRRSEPLHQPLYSTSPFHYRYWICRRSSSSSSWPRFAPPWYGRKSSFVPLYVCVCLCPRAMSFFILESPWPSPLCVSPVNVYSGFFLAWVSVTPPLRTAQTVTHLARSLTFSHLSYPVWFPGDIFLFRFHQHIIILEVFFFSSCCRSLFLFIKSSNGFQMPLTLYYYCLCWLEKEKNTWSGCEFKALVQVHNFIKVFTNSSPIPPNLQQSTWFCTPIFFLRFASDGTEDWFKSGLNVIPFWTVPDQHLSLLSFIARHKSPFG